MKKTHWKKAFKSDYLSSSDVDNKDLILTITHVAYTECMTQNGKKYCNVAYFKEAGYKPMILNVTNSKIVKRFAGGSVHLEDWNNIKVKIYVDNAIKFAGDIVEGLRIRKTQPIEKKTNLPELTIDKVDKAIEFIKAGKTFMDLEFSYHVNAEIKQKIMEGLSNEI